MVHDADLDAGVRIHAYIRQGQYTAHGIQVVVQRIDDGGLVGPQQGHVVDGYRRCGSAMIVFHLQPDQTLGLLVTLGHPVGHIIGARVSCGGVEGKALSVDLHPDSIGLVDLDQAEGLNGIGMYTPAEVNGDLSAGSGLANDRIDQWGQGVDGPDGEVYESLTAHDSVRDSDFDRHSSGGGRPSTHGQLSVSPGGQGYPIGVDRFGADQGQRVPVWIFEADQGVDGGRGAPLHLVLRRGIVLDRRLVASVHLGRGDVEVDASRGDLAASVGDRVVDSGPAGRCVAGIHLQVAAVHDRGQAQIPLRAAGILDSQNRAVSLAIVAQGIQQGPGSGPNAQTVVLGLDGLGS